MFDSIMERGFEPRATVIAARTIGGCYHARFHPDTRPLIGLALFSVSLTGDDFSFAAETRSLRDGELPSSILDWLEERMPTEGAIVSWDRWLSLPVRLSALADEKHARIRAAAADTGGQWRDLPPSMIWHLRHARAAAMPCLCGPGETEPCRPRLPAALLPDPVATEHTLIDEARRGWATWARLFVEFTEVEQPAQRAIAAAREWGTGPAPTAS